MFVQAVGKKETALANKWVIPVDILPAWAVMVTQDICFMCSNPPPKKEALIIKKNSFLYPPDRRSIMLAPPTSAPSYFNIGLIRWKWKGKVWMK